MALFLQQNMQVYGGASPVRNPAFDLGFAAIQAATGANYGIAGFTEIHNNTTAPPGVLARAAVLDPGLTDATTIAVGRTAVGNHTEYIVIVWDPAYFTPVRVGSVMWNSMWKQWSAWHAPVGLMGAPNIGMPDWAGADVRGVAWVAGTVAGNPRVFGFMHNVYTIGDKYGGFQVLEPAAKLIGTATGYGGGAEYYFGGDFNIAPRDAGTIRGILHSIAAVYPMGVLPPLVAGAFIPTTATNSYDFWATNNPTRTNAHCQVQTATRAVNRSDHAAAIMTR